MKSSCISSKLAALRPTLCLTIKHIHTAQVKHNSPLLVTEKHKASSWQIFTHCSKPLKRPLLVGGYRILNLQYSLSCSATATVTTLTLLVPGKQHLTENCSAIKKTTRGCIGMCHEYTFCIPVLYLSHFSPPLGPLHFLTTFQIFHSPPIQSNPPNPSHPPAHLRFECIHTSMSLKTYQHRERGFYNSEGFYNSAIPN